MAAQSGKQYELKEVVLRLAEGRSLYSDQAISNAQTALSNKLESAGTAITAEFASTLKELPFTSLIFETPACVPSAITTQSETDVSESLTVNSSLSCYDKVCIFYDFLESDCIQNQVCTFAQFSAQECI